MRFFLKSNFFIFFVFLIFFSIFSGIVFASDSYGNELQDVFIYKKILGVNDFIVFIDNNNYTIYMDVYFYQYSDYFSFYVESNINATQFSLSQTKYYIGCGIVLESDISDYYANAMVDTTPRFPTQSPNPDGFWDLTYSRTDISIEYNTLINCDISLWIDYDYDGGSGFSEVENYNFALWFDESSGYEPIEYPDDMNLTFIWFWGMFLCMFLCPLFLAGAIKLRKPKFIGISIFSFIGFLCFFGMFSGIRLI